MPRNKALIVALVNDYEVVLAGLTLMLEPFSGRVSVRQIEPGRMALERSDVVLYDTFARNIDLGEVLAGSNARHLVVYTWTGNPRSVAAALTMGASGYLAKGVSAEVVVDTLERVDAGETVVRTGTRITREPASGDWPGSAESLSPREAEIVAWIARGFSNDDLANQTGLSLNTVKTYVRNSYRKMGVRSRSQAVLWALEHGFVTGVPGERRW